MDDVAGAASCSEEDLCQVLEFASLCFKISWASLMVGTKFTVFAFFYFAFEGNFQVQAPGGLIFGGANTWRGLFSEFYGTLD